jgi:hypothetical protein
MNQCIHAYMHTHAYRRTYIHTYTHTCTMQAGRCRAILYVTYIHKYIHTSQCGKAGRKFFVSEDSLHTCTRTLHAYMLRMATQDANALYKTTAIIVLKLSRKLKPGVSERYKDTAHYMYVYMYMHVCFYICIHMLMQTCIYIYIYTHT